MTFLKLTFYCIINFINNTLLHLFLSGNIDLSSIKSACVALTFITTEHILAIVKLLPHVNSLQIIFDVCDPTDLLDPLILVKDTLTNLSIHCYQSEADSPFSLLPLLECRCLRSIAIMVQKYHNCNVDEVRLTFHIILYDVFYPILYCMICFQ